MVKIKTKTIIGKPDLQDISKEVDIPKQVLENNVLNVRNYTTSRCQAVEITYFVE